MSIKKILLVGNFSNNPQVYTYASSFYKAMQNIGFTVEKFNCKKKYIKISLINNILNKYFLNYLLFKKVKSFKPNLIFMLKADSILHTTLKKIKKNNSTKLINFYPDNPFTFWNGNSNSDVLLSLPLYDLFLIWSEQLIPIIYSAGAKNVQYFPFGYDPEIFSQEITITPKDIALYSSDICFIGSWDQERESWLTQLICKKPNLNLKIWGNRWTENLPQNSILKPYLQGAAIYGIDMIKAFKLSKIVLNFMRKQNLDAHNMRTIETAACGAFLLTERTKEQSVLLFKEGFDIECFGNIDELINKINFYLTNSSKRTTIMENGRKTAQKYSIEILLLEILKDFI